MGVPLDGIEKAPLSDDQSMIEQLYYMYQWAFFWLALPCMASLQRSAFEKLSLNDAALFFQPENSVTRLTCSNVQVSCWGILAPWKAHGSTMERFILIGKLNGLMFLSVGDARPQGKGGRHTDTGS